MTCSLCKTKGHNKRKCPNKDFVQPSEPAPKRAKGRPRKDANHAATTQNPTTSAAQTTTSSVQASQAISHHSMIAQPTILGRGGRKVLMWRGSRGGRGYGVVAANVGRGRGSNVVGRGRGSEAVGRGRGGSSYAAAGRGRGADAAAGRGRGADDSGRGRGRTRGRGRGRHQVPQGAGVYIAPDGSAMTTNQGNQRRGRLAID
ncbi:protein argonaute 3-like [Chenopodium quinoa]|uniref:protein argonaute 3-like n=1 Tax=Chenopodium quinoa TaxID=63459 RepID=UPI000B799953|nr:protein argonaute 3-like [Chenopodium quinoa]